ncbi:MAG: PAS domain-containing protein [Proteobacteria bacterium]|nr:PAS domain-containing protein [Pseudomonadota bacterium]
MAVGWDYADLSSATSAAIADAHAYWNVKRANREMPDADEIDPLEMRSYLGKILLIDLQDGDRFLFRLCGTEVRDLNGAELTGKYADAVTLGDSQEAFIESYRRAITSRRPVFFRGKMWWQDRGYATFEQVNLPLSENESAARRLLCVIDAKLQSPAR